MSADYVFSEGAYNDVSALCRCCNPGQLGSELMTPAERQTDDCAVLVVRELWTSSSLYAIMYVLKKQPEKPE